MNMNVLLLCGEVGKGTSFDGAVMMCYRTFDIEVIPHCHVRNLIQTKMFPF